jgi:hypothetical protein
VTAPRPTSTGSRPRRLATALAAVVLTLILLAALSPVYRDVFTGERDRYRGASFANFAGHLEYDRRLVHDFSWGAWFWNPDKAMGMPRFGEILNRPLYPVHLLAVALAPTLTAWHWISLVHAGLAAAGLVLLGLTLRWPPWLAVVGATGAMLSHGALAHFSDVIDLAAAAWLPLQLALTLKALERPGWGRWDTLWVLCAALRFLGSNPNRALYYELLVLAVVASFAWGRLRTEIPRLAARYALALLLIAPLLVPAFTHFAESARTHFLEFEDWHVRRAYKWTSYWLSPDDLRRLLSPAGLWIALGLLVALAGRRLGPFTRALGAYLVFALLHTIRYAPFWYLLAVLPGVRIPQKAFEPIGWLLVLALVETAWLAWSIPARGWRQALVAGLLVAGLAATARDLPLDPRRAYVFPPWTRALPERLAAVIRAEPRAQVLLATGPERASDDAQPLLNSNHNFFLGIPSARFFGDVPTHPFMRATYRVPGLLFITRGSTALGDWEEMVDLYAELGIRWVLWDGDDEAHHPRLGAAGEEHGFRLYEILDARPLVRAVPALRSVARPPTPRGAVELVFGVPAEGPFCYGCPPAPTPGTATAATVQWQWAPGAVTAEVESAAGTYVVLGETTSRGWRATVDGAPTPIYQVNEMFQGVWVPPGRHQVSWRFHEPAFFVGLGVMAAAAALLVVLPGRWPGPP